MSKHFVLVAGNIGAGKTSLTERVGARLVGAEGDGAAWVRAADLFYDGGEGPVSGVVQFRHCAVSNRVSMAGSVTGRRGGRQGLRMVRPRAVAWHRSGG